MKKVSIIILSILLLSFLCSCGNIYTKEQLSKISNGMSLSDVEKITGGSGKVINGSATNSVETNSKDFKTLFWENSDRTGIIVTFYNDKVYDATWKAKK